MNKLSLFVDKSKNIPIFIAVLRFILQIIYFPKKNNKFVLICVRPPPQDEIPVNTVAYRFTI